MDRLERLKDQFVAMVSPSIVAALGNHDQGLKKIKRKINFIILKFFFVSDVVNYFCAHVRKFKSIRRNAQILPESYCC